MSSLFPEQPILFYPSLACRFGAEPSILLAVYHQYARHHGGLDDQGTAQFVIRRCEWLQLAPYWDEDKLALLTSTLVDQGLVDAQFLANGSIRLAVLDKGATEQAKNLAATAELDSATDVVEPQADPVAVETTVATTFEKTVQAESPGPVAYHPPSAPAASSFSYPSSTNSQVLVSGAVAEPAVQVSTSPVAPPEPSSTITATSQHADQNQSYGHVARGPAPSFGGSTGWAKPQDPLEQLFAQQEQHNRQLKEISPNWQPQPTTLQMLAKQSVTEAFALACVDQFVAYYMEQSQRKKSWEQPFMKWVKRDWIDAQKQQHRQQSGGNYTASQHNKQQGYNGERDQTRARQDKRQRITESLMDIKNTDW